MSDKAPIVPRPKPFPPLSTDPQSLWRQTFREFVATEVSRAPDIPLAEWRRAGRVTKALPRKEDETFWENAGLDMVVAYQKWRNLTRWPLWEPKPGEPAIELRLLATFPGGHMVKMFIDRVFVNPDGELVVVDLKTGSRDPESDLQLGFYAAGIEAVYGIRPQWGHYYNARKADLSPPADLSRYTGELLGGYVDDFFRAVKHNIFIPRVGGHCRPCGFKSICPMFTNA